MTWKIGDKVVVKQDIWGGDFKGVIDGFRNENEVYVSNNYDRICTWVDWVFPAGYRHVGGIKFRCQGRGDLGKYKKIRGNINAMCIGKDWKEIQTGTFTHRKYKGKI